MASTILASPAAAAPGDVDWSSSYNGPIGSFDGAVALAVGSDGLQVFVTGSSRGDGTGHDFATVAYNAATGHDIQNCRG